MHPTSTPTTVTKNKQVTRSDQFTVTFDMGSTNQYPASNIKTGDKTVVHNYHTSKTRKKGSYHSFYRQRGNHHNKKQSRDGWRDSRFWNTLPSPTLITKPVLPIIRPANLFVSLNGNDTSQSSSLTPSNTVRLVALPERNDGVHATQSYSYKDIDHIHEINMPSHSREEKCHFYESTVARSTIPYVNMGLSVAEALTTSTAIPNHQRTRVFTASCEPMNAENVVMEHDILTFATNLVNSNECDEDTLWDILANE
jgi:hypothetical protein